MRKCPLKPCAPWPRPGRLWEVSSEEHVPRIGAIHRPKASTRGQASRTASDLARIYRFPEKTGRHVYHNGTGAALGHATARRTARHPGTAPEHGEEIRRMASGD